MTEPSAKPIRGNASRGPERTSLFCWVRLSLRLRFESLPPTEYCPLRCSSGTLTFACVIRIHYIDLNLFIHSFYMPWPIKQCPAAYSPRFDPDLSQRPLTVSSIDCWLCSHASLFLSRSTRYLLPLDPLTTLKHNDKAKANLNINHQHGPMESHCSW